MKTFISAIKFDYLQRTRSYSFLITLCTSLAIAYTFVPEPNASYSTIRIADHIGYYNSAWFGYVTAIMTSIFLSLIGFYLVNHSIATDKRTKIGLITAATPVSNFRYLFSKVVSNFLVLSTIVLIVFTMSMLLFLVYNDGFPLEISQFIKSYIFIPIPAMCLIAVLAVVFEVLFQKYSILQNIVFFFLFSAIAFTGTSDTDQYALDPFGTKIVIHQMEESVRDILQIEKKTDINIGYVIGNIKKTKKFEFNGVSFPIVFIASRLGWGILGILLIGAISPFFHRFNTKDRLQLTKSTPKLFQNKKQNELVLADLNTSQVNYGIFSLVKTEWMLLFRKGKKWLWFINLIGFALLIFLPLNIAHTMVLPILWFLQVHRLSGLSSKEIVYNVHYFAFTSHKPLQRLLTSQLIAGVTMLVLLALPLLVRLTIVFDIISVIHIITGAIFIVLVAATLGILSKGKKLFEILFFMITYCNINVIPFTDYFGGIPHSTNYLVSLGIITIALGAIAFLRRGYQLRN